MANVLPPKAVKTVWDFYRTRFVMVGSLVFAACGALALLALVPTYVAIGAERAGENSSLALPAPAPSLPSTDREDIARAQFLVRELRFASSTSSALPGIERALGARGAGVSISNIRYTGGPPTTIVIEGVARSRDDINTYRTVLSKDPHFKTVSVPIGSLAGTEDGRFTVTLTEAL